MIYDKCPKQQSKWNKAFWVIGYYVDNSRKCNRGRHKEIYSGRTEESWRRK